MSLVRYRSRASSFSPGRGWARDYKRLIVAADGTWLNSDNGLETGELSIPSNVTRISRAIKSLSSDGVQQIVYYQFGVGSKGNFVDRVVTGATGEGLSENVRECYSFICNNWLPGDEIFLIGFSRGAYTARSVGGLINQVGVLTKRGLSYLAEIFHDVQHARDPSYRPKDPDEPFPNKPSASNPRYRQELERRGLTTLNVSIKAIGVWDTVGSLGLPRIGILTRVGAQPAESEKMSFYDTKLSNCIEHAFQALALDERRSAFQPAVWEKPPGNTTILRQVWFPGVHSNIGGGYDDQQVANITLAWMMAQLQPFLDMDLDYLFVQEEINIDYYRDRRKTVRPWSFGKIYNSNSGVYAIGGATIRTPGTYYAVDPEDGRPTSRPLRETHEYIHPSVRTRFKLGGSGTDDKGLYECEALDDWKLVVDYEDEEDGKPEIYWKARFKSTNVTTRFLPESPLWNLEKMLAATDPETYSYIKNPPPSRSSRKSRRRDRSTYKGKSRPRSAPPSRRLYAPP